MRAPDPISTLDVAADIAKLISAASNSAQPAASTTSATGVCCLQPIGQPLLGGLIIAGCTGGRVAVVDVLRGQVVAVEKLHDDDVRAVVTASSPQQEKGNGSIAGGKANWRVVTTSFDGTGAVWSLRGTGGGDFDRGVGDRFKKVGSMLGHADKILSAAVAVEWEDSRGRAGHSPVGVVTTGADGSTFLWKDALS